MRFQQALFTLILVCVMCFSVLLISVKSEDDYIWKDGFLEKNYSESIKDVNSAVNLLFNIQSSIDESGTQGEDSEKTVMFSKWDGTACMSIGIQKLEGENGSIIQVGVGDKNGKWGMWTSIGTVEGLDIKEGGSIISVKVIEKDSITIVGFKVDDGDRKASEDLHELMLQKLKK